MNRPARRRSSYKNIEDQQPQQQQQQSQTNATPSSSAANTDSQNNGNGNAMDGAHRKIELQSPEDLTFLINNVRRAAEEHINAAFPPVEGQDDAAAGDDELRVRIEKLVADVCYFLPHQILPYDHKARTGEQKRLTGRRDARREPQYISKTFTLAAPNLSINGFDLDARTFPAVYLDSPSTTASPSSSHNLRRRRDKAEPAEVVQYEAFDARRRARVEELAREEEDLMREVAALKRRVPAATAKGFTEGFWEGVRADEEALGRARDVAAATVAGGGDGGDGDGQEQKEEGVEEDQAMLAGIGPLERQADVEEGYRGVVETLGRLKREMPATVAKMERARVAGEYVVTER
ncbi:putative kinetochore protein [Diaporthe ampelina]|uniref:Putative kinetochore protein n=1 Tax=Diaporthe ampelina TaxID=1214573 RepID=A0A0G2H6Y3_9PEZI|nr:putative kinetochore protein [Diaporthe ampelina]